MQWKFSSLTQSGLSIIPAVNLVSNIGFGKDATHTTSNANKSEFAELRITEFKFPIKFNEIVVPDRDFERIYHSKRLAKRKIFSKLISRLNFKLNPIVSK